MHAELPEIDALWDYDDPPATERAFRALLPAAHASGNLAYLAELLTQIARTQGLQRQFDAAHRTLDEADALQRENHPRARIRALLERGRIFNSVKSPDQARVFFLQAWERALQHGEDALAVDAAHMLGIVEQEDQQLAWNLRALELAERSANPRARRWRGSLYNNIGWCYHDRGRYDEALALFKQALAARREAGAEREVHIATWCVARALRSFGRLDEALDMQHALLEVVDRDGFVHEEVGECLLALGRRDEARAHFARAHALLSRDAWLADNEAARLARLNELAVGS